MRVFELWCKVTEVESENENREQEMNMTDLHDDTPSKPPSGDWYKMLISQMETKKQSLETRKKSFSYSPTFQCFCKKTKMSGPTFPHSDVKHSLPAL